MNPTTNDIEALFDKEVRPSLKEHGGNVQIHSLKDNVLRVKLTGKCSGCPSAHDTNETLIAEKVQAAFPQIEQVLLIEETSPELMDFARRILNHEIH